MSSTKERPATSDFLHRAKEAVHRIEPSAEVLLYGSRARGDAGPASDWDFLVLLDGPLNGERERRVRRVLYELELKTEQLVSSIIRSRAQWDAPAVRTPFQANVRREGVLL